MTKRARRKVRTGGGLVSTQIRWPLDWLDRIDQLRGDDERAAFVRGVVYQVLCGRYAVTRDAQGAINGFRRQAGGGRTEISDPPPRGRPRIRQGE